MPVIDVYEMLTHREREQLTDILGEVAARNGIILDVWEPIIQIESTYETGTHKPHRGVFYWYIIRVGGVADPWDLKFPKSF